MTQMYIQGPVGRGRIPTKYFWLPGDMMLRGGANTLDYVFFIPPRPFYTGRRRDFDLSLDDAWYGRVSLLFKAQFRTDIGDIRELECVMIDVLFNYAEGR